MFGSSSLDKSTDDVGQQVAKYTALKLSIETLLVDSQQIILKSIEDTAPDNENFDTAKQQNIGIIEKLTKVASEAPDFRRENYEIFKTFSENKDIPKNAPYILNAMLESLAAIIANENKNLVERKGLHGKSLTKYQLETLETIKAINTAIENTGDKSKEKMQKLVSSLLTNLVVAKVDQDESANDNINIIHYLFEQPSCRYNNIEPVVQKSSEDHILKEIVPHACGRDIPDREERLMHLLTAKIAPNGSSGTAVVEENAPQSLDFALKFIEKLKAADENLLNRSENGKLVSLIAQKLVSYAQNVTENAEHYAREKFEEIHSLLLSLDSTGVVQYADEEKNLSDIFANVKSNIDTIEQEQNNIAKAQNLKVTICDNFDTAESAKPQP